MIIYVIYYLKRSYLLSKRLEELINKLLKWNLSQAFLQDLTSTKKLHCKTTIFWETPPNDCFCLEIRNRKYCFCLARHILLPYFFPYTDVINISKYNISIVILWRTLLWIFRKWFLKTLKKYPFTSQHTYKFSEVLFCAYCEGLFCL